MKKVVIAVVILLFGTAWWSTVRTFVSRPAEYRQCIKRAEEFEEKEIYYDAILAYRQALEIYPESMEIYLKMAEDYGKLGDTDGFEEMCNSAIALGGDNEEAIFMLADYYLENNDRSDAISLLRRQSKKKNNGAILEKLLSLAGGYSFLNGEYDEISSPCSGYMYVKNGDKTGLIDETGREIIRPQYESIGLFGSSGFAPVRLEGKWFYIDQNNYKRREPDEDYDFLGVVNQGIIPAVKDEKWGYLNEEFEPLTEFAFDWATPVLNGIAAVKQGEKWALIDGNLKFLTEFGFDDVVMDEWGFCSRNGVVFVRVGEKYSLINNEGVKVGKESFDDVQPFVSGQAAAVEQAGKWGFLSADGEKVLECMYQEAKSFSGIGYAPVKVEGLWGYIKSNGDLVLDPEFEDAKIFNSKGIAPIKKDGFWRLIQLDIY